MEVDMGANGGQEAPAGPKSDSTRRPKAPRSSADVAANGTGTAADLPAPKEGDCMVYVCGATFLHIPLFSAGLVSVAKQMTALLSGLQMYHCGDWASQCKRHRSVQVSADAPKLLCAQHDYLHADTETIEMVMHTRCTLVRRM